MKKSKFNKWIFLIFILIFTMLFSSVGVLAAPANLAAGISSTNNSLLTLKAPDSQNVSTTNKLLPVSAVAPVGSVVAVYKYNAGTGEYNKVYMGEKPVEATVGATMLFASQVELTLGTNKFLVYCEAGEQNYQITEFEVKLLNQSFIDKLKSIAGMIFN